MKMKRSFTLVRLTCWLALGPLAVGLLAAGGARADGGAPLAPSLTSAPAPAPSSLERRIGAYLAHRPGAVTVTLDDGDAEKLWLYGPGLQNDTASIINVDILEARLYQGRPRRKRSRSPAGSMCCPASRQEEP
jgi:hypothetical protein